MVKSVGGMFSLGKLNQVKRKASRLFSMARILLAGMGQSIITRSLTDLSCARKAREELFMPKKNTAILHFGLNSNCLLAEITG